MGHAFHGHDVHDGHGHGHDGHGHSHAHGRGPTSRRLTAALALTTLYMLAEVAGGLWTGSLALMADAGHMLSDSAALALSLFAIRMAQRAATPERTFGFHRSEVLAALANGAGLLAIAVMISIEAVGRFATPAPVMGLPMFGIAVGGLVMNLLSMGLLHGGDRESLNLRGALLHVMMDALGSVGAIVAGLLIWARGWQWADPLASLLIALLVVVSAVSLMRDAIAVLMEGTPEHIDLLSVRQALQALPGVEEVHDLHVWLITSGLPSASAHVRVSPDADGDALLAEAGRMLTDRFGIDHSTIQIERSDAAGCCNGCTAATG